MGGVSPESQIRGGVEPPTPAECPGIVLLTYSPYTCRVLTGDGPARKRGPANVQRFVRGQGAAGAARRLGGESLEGK